MVCQEIVPSVYMGDIHSLNLVEQNSISHVLVSFSHMLVS
jgi:hypothetical protein